VVLPQHSIAIDQGRIVAILPISEAQNRYQAQRQINLQQHVVCPGLVNLHGHSAMSLLRGLADDLTLQTWLQQHIWPAEAKHVRDEFVEDGTLLAIVEMQIGRASCRERVS
jgi:5-methylthioadenosine/S-adenosylhomocysteine deaminase